MRQDISAIEKTMTLPENREALSDAARRILAAKRVYVTGGRASAALAALLALDAPLSRSSGAGASARRL